LRCDIAEKLCSLVLKEFGREKASTERAGIFYDVGCTLGSGRHEILVLGRVCTVSARTVVVSRHSAETSVPPIPYVDDPDYSRRLEEEDPRMCMQVATSNRGRGRTQGQEDSVRFAGVPGVV
jgi:hypothetical protein